MKIKKIFRSSNNACTVFIPLKEPGCSVTKLNKLLDGFFNSKYKKVVIDDYSNHFSKHLKNYNLPYPKRIILFAHPHKNFRVLLCNKEDRRDILLPHWWMNPGEKPLEIIFANVCEGSEIFSEKIWQDIFPVWISFKGKIHFFINSKLAEDSYMKLYTEIIRQIHQGGSVNEIKQKVSKIFEAIISQLYDKLDKESGDVLTLKYIIESYNTLITSED